jgi:hypothetical protein
LYPYSADNKIKKVKITGDTTDDKALVANATCDVVRLKDGSGVRWNFAVVNVKSISASSYDPDDKYTYNGTIAVTTYGTSIDDIDVSFLVEYDEQGANGTLGESLAYYEYENDDDELDLSDESGNLTLTADIIGSGKAIAAVSNDSIESLEEKYDTASLTFYVGTGTFTRVRNAVLTIEPDNDERYLYKYENGKLTDLSNTYDKSENAFIIKGSGTSFTLGTYVVSDIKLSGAVATTTTSSESSTTTSSTTTSSSTTLPANPSTGAAA